MADEDYSQYPSIDEAYGLVLPSYDWMLRRFEAIHGRLQNAVALTATVFFLSIPVIKSVVPDASFWSPCFWMAAAVFLAAIAFGGWALYWGGDLKVLHAETVYKRHLHRSPMDFKVLILKAAGDAFSHNDAVVRRKALAALILMAALVVTLIFLTVWALTSA